MKLQDRVIVVTGGANGIGAALCRRFAKESPRGIVVADLDEANARAVADQIGGLAVVTDVSREADIVRLVAEAEAHYGPIDLFCSNAGILVLDDPLDQVTTTPNQSWQRIWQINVMAHIYAARAVLPGMLERGSGYLLNTASAAGLLSQIGSAPYSVSKHAAVAFAECLAIAHGDQGIVVSVLCPQAVATQMMDNVDQGQNAAAVDGILPPEAVAAAAVAGIAEEHFLILPHPQVAEYMQRKTSDYDRWLGGMRRFRRQLLGL